ncbi:MAG: hypothetical protein KBA57_06415 [Sphingomonadaceae bacterium]|jgi:hypothetical protein|nr:hypothetical protein [Sphingomonadaceae bacterium]
MSKKILNVATFGLAGALLKPFSKKKKETVAPVAEPTMPIADDEAILRARKRAVAQQMQRGGRSSTILTDNSDSLGA